MCWLKQPEWETLVSHRCKQSWVISVEMTVCSCRLDGKHVVFGSVVEGMDVVRKMESYGSQSGKTSSKICIADCGQLWAPALTPSARPVAPPLSIQPRPLHVQHSYWWSQLTAPQTLFLFRSCWNYVAAFVTLPCKVSFALTFFSTKSQRFCQSQKMSKKIKLKSCLDNWNMCLCFLICIPAQRALKGIL